MVLTPHLLAGAVIGAKTHNLGLIIILGLLSHLILDRIPHWDYPNSGISNFKDHRNFKNLIIDILKIVADGVIGLIIILVIALEKNDLLQPKNIIFMSLGVFFATLPDISLILSFLIFPEKISKKIIRFHNEFFHYKRPEENEKKSLGLILEISITLIAILVFFF
jgi:hypothetical protein